MVVIYTADIEPRQTKKELDIGCLQFQLEEAFLTQKDSEKTEARLYVSICRQGYHNRRFQTDQGVDYDDKGWTII